jgi:hypothetical protein
MAFYAPKYTNQLNDTEKSLQQIIGNLEELINLTEKKYSYIYDSLPTVERDVDLSVREVEILLKHLVYNTITQDAHQKSVTVDAINTIRSEFAVVTSSFLNEELLTELFRAFMDTSDTDTNNFSELIRMVNEVEDSLADLRDLALNSIIFAVRIGDQGAAFQILSDYINQISMGLGALFVVMKEYINGLNDWNDGFKKDLTEFRDYEENLKDKYQIKVQGEFELILDTLKCVCDVLGDNLAETKKSFSEVGYIMVVIQNQDIIRQNIENMIKCLQIVQERKEVLTSDSLEKRLDYVVFSNKVLVLCDTLMDNVEASLQESIGQLGNMVGKMFETMGELETDSFYLTKLFAGSKVDASAGLMSEVFESISTKIANLLVAQTEIDSMSSSLLDSRERFIELMGLVENDFSSINKEAKRLRKMKVLIKIELARLNTGSDIVVNTIATAVEQVIDTINNNQQAFLKLRNYFLINLDRFERALGITQKKMGEGAGILEGSNTKLDTVKQMAVGAVLASHNEMHDIFLQIKDLSRELTDIQSINNIFAGAKTNIEQFIGKLSLLQEQLFKEAGVTNWEEKEEDLKLLMEQFTCFVERKAMISVAGGIIEDIGDDGGVVLF